MLPTLTCYHCKNSTQAAPRHENGRYYYDCPGCGKSTRLKAYSVIDGHTELIPSKTGRENRDMLLQTVYIRRETVERLKSRCKKRGDYAALVNKLLEDGLSEIPE